MKYSILFFLCGLVAIQVEAQHLVHGRILDGTTREALPAATIHVDGTYRGTITNSNGAYELQVDRLPVILVVRYIGYETLRHTITAADALEQDVLLSPMVVQLEEVVVTGDADPAVRIMQEVIARKKIWRAALETHEAPCLYPFYGSQRHGNCRHQGDGFRGILGSRAGPARNREGKPGNRQHGFRRRNTCSCSCSQPL